MKPSLLITMRDIAGASHLVEVIRTLERDNRFNFRVAAQMPASDFLTRSGIAHQRIKLPPAKEMASEAAANLLAAARQLLAERQTDAVLVGLSTPIDGGIDEAILAEATVPTFLLQDFWGECNDFFGRTADIFFVLDETAKQCNTERFGTESVIVGSARHSAYATQDFFKIKRHKRRLLGIDQDAQVIGYFAQALHHMEGYHRTVRSFIEAVEQMPRKVTILLRKHPRETSDHFQTTVQLFEQSYLEVVIDNNGFVEDCLATCDVVCSMFSNCAYDASFQNFYSPSPLLIPMVMLFDPQISAWFSERIDLKTLPTFTKKLVVPVYERNMLDEVLETC
jgi:hypothetical protein